MVLYALGSNGCGQLGIGSQNDVNRPTVHELAAAAHDIHPIAIRAGGNHTLILCEDGSLYLSGKTPDGNAERLPKFKQITLQTSLIAENVSLCSATWEASILVVDNQVFTYGKGDRGELGRANSAKPLLSFPNISAQSETNPHIVDVASGLQHTVVVFDDGDVWGWGNGRKGQLGGDQIIVTQPRRIRGIGFKVLRSVCGREFTFLAGDPNEGHCLALGSDKWGVISKAPKSIPGWIDVGACWSTVIILLSSGKIVSWGRGDRGQLAPANLSLISKVVCGSEHCLALTASNNIIAWGWGEHGNCGPNTDDDHDIKGGWTELRLPALGDKFATMGIGAGCGTSWIWGF